MQYIIQIIIIIINLYLQFEIDSSTTRIQLFLFMILTLIPLNVSIHIEQFHKNIRLLKNSSLNYALYWVKQMMVGFIKVIIYSSLCSTILGLLSSTTILDTLVFWCALSITSFTMYLLQCLIRSTLLQLPGILYQVITVFFSIPLILLNVQYLYINSLQLIMYLKLHAILFFLFLTIQIITLYNNKYY